LIAFTGWLRGRRYGGATTIVSLMKQARAYDEGRWRRLFAVHQVVDALPDDGGEDWTPSGLGTSQW
jgi:hypothetical protein